MRTNRQLFQKYLAQTTAEPMALEVDHAEGIYIYGPDGKKYMDLISGISVSNVGHNNPDVVDAIKSQLDKHMHVMVYGEYIQAPQVQLAEALINTLPDHIESCFFVNSGSEAVEGALKLAKRYTGRTRLVSFNDAYHGSTHGALSVCGNEKLKQAFRPLLPDVIHLPFGELDPLDQINEQVAAVIIETVQGEAGVRKASKVFFEKLQSRCKEMGALLIIDEIQTGFGRTGTFWCFDQYALRPDIVVSAKALGGGMPIGVFLSTHEIMHTLTFNPILGHISTFGGHPVSAAAALANLKFVLKEDLIRQVTEKSEYLIEKLQHRHIKNVRYSGLLIAIEFESFDLLLKIIDEALKEGLIVDWFLFNDNSMRIAPPLIITKEQLDEVATLLLKAMDGVQG